MQIYTQNPNHARKNMNFFLSQRVNRSTSQRVFRVLKGLLWVCYGSVMGLLGSAWVCFRVCEKNYTYLIH